MEEKRRIDYWGMNHGKTERTVRAIAAQIQEWFVKDGVAIVEIRVVSPDYRKAIEALKYYALIHESAWHIVSGEPALETLRELGEL